MSVEADMEEIEIDREDSMTGRNGEKRYEENFPIGINIDLFSSLGKPP